MARQKKLTLRKRKSQFKLAAEFYRWKAEERRKAEAEKMNKLFIANDV